MFCVRVCVFAVRLFLVAAALLSCCAASEDGVSGKILAFDGESVILPCRMDVSGDFPTVEWSKEGLDRGIAFLYRDGCETHEMKNPVFRYRTNLFMNELMRGNISLRISSLRLSDTGTYICKTILKKAQKVIRVELFVGAFSEPRLSVVPAVGGGGRGGGGGGGGGGGVTLQCEANCWFPKPEVTFLDHQGNSIGAEDPKTNLDSRGCFTVTRRLTVQADTNRRICRVHQPRINQMRETEIYIPADCMTSCTLTTSIAVVVTVVVCALTAFLWKKYGNFVCGHKLPPSVPHDKDEIIRQPTEELSDLRSKQSPVVCQPTIHKSPSRSSPDISKPINQHSHQFHQENNQNPAVSISNRPKPGNKDSKPGVSRQSPAPGLLNPSSCHNHSSPALLTDNAAVSSTSFSASPEQNHVVRSMSLSESQPRSNGARPQRRYTMSATSNRFSPLENITEDSEPLL